MPTAIDLFEKARRHERMEQLRAAREHDLMPYFRVVEAEPGPIALMEGRERITLGSNNYLGLTGDARVKQAAREALEHYGTGLTGSRFMNGTTPLHLELERELADWMGSEDALVYTTGYLANTGAIGTLLDVGDTVVCDSGDHASILDAVALSRARVRPFRHNRLDKLESMLSRAESDGGGVLVVVDGLFSMEGDLAPLPDIVALCREHGALADFGYQGMEPNRLPDGSGLVTPIVPVLVGDDWRAVLLWKALYDAGVYVNVAIYPAVQRGGALLRTSVMATHEIEHLDRALAVFERVKDEVERMTPPDLGPPAAAPEAGADKLGGGTPF